MNCPHNLNPRSLECQSTAVTLRHHGCSECFINAEYIFNAMIDKIDAGDNVIQGPWKTRDDIKGVDNE
jgi:hypothetical protein